MGFSLHFMAACNLALGFPSQVEGERRLLHCWLHQKSGFGSLLPQLFIVLWKLPRNTEGQECLTILNFYSRKRGSSSYIGVCLCPEEEEMTFREIGRK